MKDIKIIAGMGALGAVIAGGLVVIGTLPEVLAADAPLPVPIEAMLNATVQDFLPPAVDPKALVRWDFVADPGISTEPIRQSTVTKIGYGRVEKVEIVETASGIYSSDAMTDPHVQYPGIVRSRKTDVASLKLWDGFGWSAAAPFTAGSFITMTPFAGGNLIVTDDSMCVVTKHGISC